MAAAIIPIIASAIPVLVPEIPKIVQAVEGLFGAKTGPQKLDTATALASQLATDLAKAGKIQGVPDLSSITTMVEQVVQALKAAGQLPAPTAPAPATAPVPAPLYPSTTAQSVPTFLTGATVLVFAGK